MKFYRSFFLLLFSSTALFVSAQPGLPLEKVEENLLSVEFEFPEAFAINAESSSKSGPQKHFPPPPLIPTAYNFDHLGWFCKLEVKIEKQFRIPVKFRLGEVQYAEWLEYGDQW